MNVKKIVGASLLTLGLAASGVASADSLDQLGQVSVKLVNNSGYEIQKLYFSPIESTSWGRDLLGSGTLPTGWTETISTNPGHYDLRLVDRDGDVCAVQNVQVLADRSVTISRDALLHCEGY